MAKQTASACDTAYLKELKKLDGDLEGRTSAERYLSSTVAGISSKSTGWAATPYFIDEGMLETFEHAATTMSSIMEKIMAKYQRDRTFRPLLALDPAVERMTMVPTGCRRAVPLARIDLFYDRKTADFKICGIVTGGLDGMVENVSVTRAVQQMGAFRSFTEAHPNIESFDTIANCSDALLETYGNWANAREGRNHPLRPSIAVVDFADSARAAETECFVGRLGEQGCYAHATDPSRLRIDRIGGVEQLVDDEGPISCVWLRATADEAVVRKSAGIDTLLTATRRGLVCTIGGYRSWPCCTKSFLQLLRTKECRNLLTHEENDFIEAHIIRTSVITPATDISDFYDQEMWVLKCADGGATHEAYAGVDMTKSAWRNRLIKSIKRHDAIQELVPEQTQKVVPGIVGEDDPCATKDMNVMLGLYLFEGELGGIRAICGTGNTIAAWKDRLAMGCLVVRS